MGYRVQGHRRGGSLRAIVSPIAAASARARRRAAARSRAVRGDRHPAERHRRPRLLDQGRRRERHRPSASSTPATTRSRSRTSRPPRSTTSTSAGPGVDKASAFDNVTVTWNVTLVDGLYKYQCDAHPTIMKGSIRVGPPPPPPAPKKLTGKVGPAKMISLKKGASRGQVARRRAATSSSSRT